MLSFTRGDTKRYKFKRRDTHNNVIEVEPQSLFFTVVKDPKTDPTVLIQKSIDDFEFTEDFFWHFRIESEDTADLPYGKYFYDIEVTQDNVTTSIVKGWLELTYEATVR